MDLSSLASTAISNIKSGVSGAISNISSSVENLTSGIKSGDLSSVASLLKNTPIGRNIPWSIFQKPKSGSPIFNTLGNQRAQDTRVTLLIPSSYLVGKLTSGIVFPYTPEIKQDYKATYTPANTIHSNYTNYGFKSSTPGEISISGKFSVQNTNDAEQYIGTINTLRTLIKMQTANDDMPGAPPPICRLYAYGKYMFDNTPVVLSTFSLSLPADVDYISVDGADVPTLSTVSITLIPMYSRQEMLDASIKDWVASGIPSREKGYL